MNFFTRGPTHIRSIVKEFIHQGILEETHLIQFLGLYIDVYFADWLTIETIQLEACQEAVKQSFVNHGKLKEGHLLEITKLGIDSHAPVGVG